MFSLRDWGIGGQSEIAQEQLFVKELMETTPSSSFGEEAWRDGYIYNRECHSPLEYSDDESAEAVVSSTQPIEKESSDLFEKVEVQKLASEDTTAKTSLLSGALAAVKSQDKGLNLLSMGLSNSIDGELYAAGGMGRVQSRSSSVHDAEDDADTGGCSARQLISAVLKSCAMTGVAPSVNLRPIDAFDLRIAEENGRPDLDFPELDSAAAIIDVGVDMFSLCEQGKTEPVLVIEVIPEGSGGKQSTSMVLQVAFYEPGRRADAVHMSLPIELMPDPLWFGATSVQTRSRRGSSRTCTISQEGLGIGASGELLSNGAPPSSRIRNIDTGEEISIGDYDQKVPHAISPMRLFGGKSNGISSQKSLYTRPWRR